MKRQWQYSGNSLLAAIIFAGLMILVYATAVNHDRIWDMTAVGANTLDARSAGVAAGITQDVEILVFDNPAAEKAAAGDLLKRYHLANERISWRFIDPDLNLGRAGAYGIDRYGQAVIIAGNRRQKIETVDEQNITVGLLQVTRAERKLTCFLAGHGELDPLVQGHGGLSLLKDALETLDYEVRTVSLGRETIPPETDLLIVAGCRKDLLPEESAQLRGFREKGGDFLVGIDGSAPLGIAEMLAAYGVRSRDDLVIDAFSRVLGGDYTTPVVSLYGDIRALDGFTYASFFPTTCSLAIDTAAARWIARTSEQSWAETDLEAWNTDGRAELEDADVPGPVDIGAYAEVACGDVHSRLVVFGDSDFMSDVYFNVSGNSELLLNCINMLLEEQDLIVVGQKDHPDKPFVLTPGQARLVFWLPVATVPLLILIMGVVVVRRWRRN